MNLRLSIFWFLYMAGLGIFFPYFSLYLGQELGLAGGSIGVVVAMIPLIGLFTQPIWGQLADRTGTRRGALALAILGVALANLVIVRVTTFSMALLSTAFLAASVTAVLPMATAVTLAAQSRRGGSAFGFVRMWGTLGFLFSVVTFPRALPYLDETSLPFDGLQWMFPATAIYSLLAAVAALCLPRTEAMVVRSASGDTGRLLRHVPVRRLLALVFLAHLCMQGPINIFPLLVAERGGDVAEIGTMWVLMLLLEIPLIAFSGTTLERFGARTLLMIGLLAEGLRWTVSAWVPDLDTVRWVQLCHGIGVAGVIIGGPLYLEQSVPERLRSTGQTLVSTIGFGLASILSISAAGWLFEHFGSRVPYGVAGAGALLLGLCVHRWLPEPRRPTAESPPISVDRGQEAVG
ncbi:MAG: MFS transporter [Thermoanaerobaculia bacterium]|nr:MFS transporter [Thermoanaerobaculia bacterium]